MEEIKYLHESLIYGQLGKFLTIFSFVSSILALVSFIVSKQKKMHGSNLVPYVLDLTFLVCFPLLFCFLPC